LRYQHNFALRLFVTHATTAVVALIAVFVLLSWTLTEVVFRQKERELVVVGTHLASMVGEEIEGSLERVRVLVSTVDPFLDAEVYYLDSSAGPPVPLSPGVTMRGHGLPDEDMALILRGQHVVKRDWLGVPPDIPVHVPVWNQGRVVGALGLSAPAEGAFRLAVDLRRAAVWSLLVAFSVAAIFSWRMALLVAKPISQMKKAAQDVVEGRLDSRVPVPRDPDMAALSKAFNRAVEQLQEASESQERLDRMRRDFLANVSHEFKTPLTSLKGYVELFREGAIEEHDRSKALDLMGIQVCNLGALVDDLLELARIEGTPAALVGPVPAARVVKTAIKAVEWQAAENSVSVSAGIAGEPGITVLGDERRLVQALRNLLENGIRMSPAGEVVAVKVGRSRSMAVFQVEDSGPGVPEEHREGIWERFQQIRAPGTPGAKGSGLGLAIAREIIRQHGGTVFHENRPEGGAIFGFQVPLAKGEEV